uniref:Uncharacterized protein n=1 Tax=Rhizophora mucronata TaxID=61149 RepID=A0A2P2Q6W3_RHIMU
MVLSIFPIELVLRGSDLLFHPQILMPHVLHFYRDIPPRPLEGEANWVLKMVDSINMVSNGSEFFLSSFEL